jgi:inositol transport system substrate-binding protein
MTKRYIYILLTKYPDRRSKVFSGLSRGYYTHASIGFDESYSTFFSFTRKGFRVESPHRISSKIDGVPCLLYRLEVSENVYIRMNNHVEKYLVEASLWKYNTVGLIFGMLRFPFYQKKYRRFCSQFVAEMLEMSNVTKQKKRSSVMFPKDIIKIPELKFAFEGTLNTLCTC